MHTYVHNNTWKDEEEGRRLPCRLCQTTCGVLPPPNQEAATGSQVMCCRGWCRASVHFRRVGENIVAWFWTKFPLFSLKMFGYSSSSPHHFAFASHTRSPSSPSLSLPLFFITMSFIYIYTQTLQFLLFFFSIFLHALHLKTIYIVNN